MATFTKVNDFVLNLCEAMDLDGDELEFSLTLTDPAAGTDATADGNGVLANIAPITYTNYTDDLSAARVLTSGSTTHTQTSGTFTLDYTADIIITATPGALADWRYIVLWDDTVTSPVDPLINIWDHGSTISLAASDSATLQFNASGILTLV